MDGAVDDGSAFRGKVFSGRRIKKIIFSGVLDFRSGIFKQGCRQGLRRRARMLVAGEAGLS